ncbi:MAG: retropepsin-like domain-containing protein [Prosthecobacter sp.]|uniref:retropepsin-like aspartic protease n=1 Tax=Prosthecobacter sp. TaxID=1965333 RepID=UPI0025CBA224|nr:retropepsin-like aspartic protease [Prosthecobacter sp.]MCF7788081.1 retropepsin-like domain-containing protein [Prosthecobacter sp.]
MPSFISCGLAVIEISVGASAVYRDYCLERMEVYRRPDRQVPALIDTGADATVIDLDVLEALCLASYDVRRVQDFNGGSQEYPIYVVRLQVRTKSGAVIFEDANFEVVGAPLKSESYQAILGLDVLHAFTLKFHRQTGFVEIAATIPE